MTMLHTVDFTDAQLIQLNAQFEGAPAEDIISWAV
jgi:hypothetical protein